MTRTGRSTHHLRRRLALLTGVALAAGGMISVPAGATTTPSGDAGTAASVGGGANTPVIECGWALNDADHNWNATGEKMQYGQDDDPVANPGAPCASDGAGGATMADNVKVPVIHVKPNAHDDPTQAFVELWGAVTSSNPAGTIVYFDVYHPDGSLKVQVDATRYANSATPGLCAGPTGMFDAAKATGQLTTDAISNIQSECAFQQKGLWYGAFGISKHQPYGLYRIVMHAANAGGAETTLTYYLQVQSFYQLEKDFTTINFGTTSPNSHFWQPTQGDFTFDGVDNPSNQKSSVRNTGNAGIGLNVRFSSLCLTTAASCTDDKRIDHFDAKFGKVISGMQSLGDTSLASALTSDLTSSKLPAPYGPWYQFDANINRVLCPNDVAKIEFSVWTENIQGGSYTAPNGNGLMARPEPAAGCPTDVGAPYNAPPTPTSNTHHSV